MFFIEASDTNFVLVVDGQNVTIIDSGYPKDRDLVDASVAKIGRSFGDVRAVVLTHGHVDHKGSAERLRRDHQIPAHCHADEAPIARGEVKQQISTFELRRAWRPKIFRFAFNAIRNGGETPISWNELRSTTLASILAVRSLREGQALDNNLHRDESMPGIASVKMAS